MRCAQNAHWTDVISEDACDNDVISAVERRRRDAVWELFTSECVFLLDHLMALKHVNAISLPRGAISDI